MGGSVGDRYLPYSLAPPGRSGRSLSDSDADVLTGSAGYDWFLSDPTRDRVTDLSDEAFTTELPFITG